MKLRNLIAMSLTLLMGVSATFRPYAQAPADAGRKSDGQGYRVYGVAFYNLENLFDTINNNGRYDLEFSPKGGKKWDGHKYKNKLKNLATVISDLKTETTPLGPAIVGVSEVENKSVLDDLVATEPLRKLGMKVVHHDSPDLRGVDVGLLYNPRLFQVINVTNHRLNIEGQPNFKTRDQMCVVGLLEGSRVAVIVNHWPSRRGGAKSSYLREAAADLTKSIADSLHKIDPNMGVIVMGDLNDDPHDISVSKNLGALHDAKDVRKGGFFNPFWQKLDQGFGSYVYRNSWDLFDQIIVDYNLVNGSTGLEYVDAVVHNKPYLIQQEGQYKDTPLRTFASDVWLNGYSDHLPTEIFLRKKVMKP